MVEAGTENANGVATLPESPRSVAITRRGIHSGKDFAQLMAALMGDVVEGRMSPDVANSAVNAGGKLLKVVEMKYKYGSRPQEEHDADFMLAP